MVEPSSKGTNARETKKTANAAKPKDAGVGFGGASVTFKITPAPITLAAGPASGPIKAGGKATIPVTLTRLYGYNEAVQVTVAGRDLGAPGEPGTAWTDTFTFDVRESPDATTGSASP